MTFGKLFEETGRLQVPTVFEPNTSPHGRRIGFCRQPDSLIVVVKAVSVDELKAWREGQKQLKELK